MRVLRLPGKPVLVALEPFAEIELSNKMAPDEQIEGAVDGRFADALAPLPQLRLDLIDREMFIGGEDDLGHRFSLLRDRESALSQESPEESNKRRDPCRGRSGW
jgi:hypothetical protein